MWIVFLFSKIFPKPLDSFRKRVYNNIRTNKCSDLRKAVVVEGGESSKGAVREQAAAYGCRKVLLG